MATDGAEVVMGHSSSMRHASASSWRSRADLSLPKDVESLDTDSSSDEERMGHSSWFMGSLHLITAVIGAGVLSLPQALAWLGWVVGIPLFVLFFCITMWTARMLTDVHEVDGRQHATYREAVRNVLGRWHSYVLATAQYSNVWLTTVGYTVAAGTSMQYIARGACVYQGIAPDTCFDSMWVLIALFGGLQLVLAQLPNLESLWWVSAIGAAMSIGYSLLAFALGAMDASNRLGSLWGIQTDPMSKLFGVFSSIGSIAFAFNCAVLVMEIQSTLREPPKAAIGMKKSLWGGLGTAFSLYLSVAITSYMALGNSVPGDVLTGFSAAPLWLNMLANAMVLVHMVAAVQMYSQPIYQAIEAGLRSKWPHLLARRSKRMPVRMVYRSINVVVVTGISMGLPFFSALSGLIGAMTYYPLGVLYPMLCWSAVYRPSQRYKAFMILVNVVMAIVSLIATAGAFYNLIMQTSFSTSGSNA